MAEQYLLNAAHDVADSIITYYADVIDIIRSQYGAPEITIHYPEFPLLCKRLRECEKLVRETRQDYEKRRENYDKVRTEYFDYFVDEFEKLQNAEVNAAYDKEKLQREVILAKKSTTVWQAVSLGLAILSAVLGITSVWLALG